MDGRSPVELTKTTTQLLDALADASNESVWVDVDARFRPVVTGLARRLGLNASAADEVAQETLAEFLRAYRGGRYERSAGRLSSWLLGIAHNTSLHAIRTQRRNSGAGAPPEDLPDESALRSIWTEERDRSILFVAMAQLRDDSAVDDRTLRAFELVGLRGVPADAAAVECGMSVDQVYVAKSRVTQRLRTIVTELTDAFEDDG